MKAKFIFFVLMLSLLLADAPCLGEVDYIALESFFRDDVIKVIEIHGHQKPEDILSGVEKLNMIF